MSAPARVAVIGGGITGLAAAYELAIAEGGPQEVVLFEADERLGGKIETERPGEFVLELGPDSFLRTKPWAQQLCQELGLERELIGTNPVQRDVFILHDGRLVPLPDGLTMMVPTNLAALATTRLLGPLAKARAALEPFLPAANGDRPESIKAFIGRRFGPQVYSHLVEPMMSGIYAGDGSELSIQATFPQLPQWEREYGSVMRGALRLRADRRPKDRPAEVARSLFLAPRSGLGRLVASLTSRLQELDVTLLTGRAAMSLAPTAGGYELTDQAGERWQLGGVVLTVPAFVTARLLEPWSTDLARDLQQIEYAATATVNLAYEDEALADRLSGYGYVIPRAEGRPALACTWSSTKFPGRAPEGTALLRIFLGRVGQEEMVFEDENTLLELAKEELRSTLGIHQEPTLSRLKRWPRAMPQYNVGHLDRVARIEAAVEQLENLEVAGSAYHGIGIPDCIRDGRRAARSLLGTAD